MTRVSTERTRARWASGAASCTIANDAGAHHARATGDAAGRFLASGDGRVAADIVSRLTPTVVAEHMDVRLHKSPFVFEEGELPVAMLFPAEDKRPLEFDQALTPELLRDFAAEHGTTLKPKEEPALPKDEM